VTGGRSIASGTSEVGTSPQPFSPVAIPGTSATSTATLPFNVNLGASAPSSGLFLGHRSPNFAVDFFITAAEAKGVGKLLSKPRVITQNNEKRR